MILYDQKAANKIRVSIAGCFARWGQVVMDHIREMAYYGFGVVAAMASRSSAVACCAGFHSLTFHSLVAGVRQE